jgi:hypothetical protein
MNVFARIPRTPARWAAAALIVSASAFVAAPAAQATPQRLCAVVEVPESTRQTHVKTLAPWESVTVTPGGRIWAGVWFTGENGPEGWNAIAPWYYPLPGARQYSLIAGVSGQSWSYVGSSTRTFSNNSPDWRSLYARTNDNTPGNGSGAFTLTYCYYT